MCPSSKYLNTNNLFYFFWFTQINRPKERNKKRRLVEVHIG
jgi:hypothetical protein